MKIALCNEVLRDWPLDRQAGYAAALGYDGLEIAPFTLDPAGPVAVTLDMAAKARETVEAEGVVVSGLHWLLVAPDGPEYSITDPGRADKTDVAMARWSICAPRWVGTISSTGRRSSGSLEATRRRPVQPHWSDSVSLPTTQNGQASTICWSRSPPTRQPISTRWTKPPVSSVRSGRNASPRCWTCVPPQRRKRAHPGPAGRPHSNRSRAPRPFQRPEPARTGTGGL